MLVRKLAEQRRLYRARVQPALVFTSFPVDSLLRETRKQHFPHLTQRVRFLFVERGPLACITSEADPATIYAHQVLNHRDTPVEVLSLVCKHELLHLVVPPQTVEGKEEAHPPEFWAREKAIAPERGRAWRWVWMNFCGCLKLRPRLKRIDVETRWRDCWSHPLLTLAECAEAAPEMEYNEQGW